MLEMDENRDKVRSKMDKLMEIRGLKRIIPLRDGKAAGRAVHAVDGIDLDIYRNEILALVGESGCGKSTLGKTIVNLQKPIEGEVLLKGKNIFEAEKKERKRLCQDMQIIFQDIGASLNPRKTIETILSTPYRVHCQGMSGSELRDKAAGLLERVGLNPPETYLQRYPHEFSGGQRQRIGIARAIALSSQFIVADEPVSALDVSVRGQILNLMKDLQQDLELTYLFITHDLSVVRSIADRVAVMYLGKIVEISEASDFFRNTLHPYAKAILSATPIADPELSKRRRMIELQGEPPSPVNIPTGCRFHERCPSARPICQKQEPELMDCGNGHLAACHLAGEKQYAGAQ